MLTFSSTSWARRGNPVTDSCRLSFGPPADVFQLPQSSARAAKIEVRAWSFGWLVFSRSPHHPCARSCRRTPGQPALHRPAAASDLGAGSIPRPASARDDSRSQRCPRWVSRTRGSQFHPPRPALGSGSPWPSKDCPYDETRARECRVHWRQLLFSSAVFITFENAGNLYTGYWYRYETTHGDWFDRLDQLGRRLEVESLGRWQP